MIGDFITSVCTVVVFVIIIAFCCLSDSNDSKKSSSPKKHVTKQTVVRNSHHDNSYCECPSCGAPYYDGYCEECGYPDINQGWIGENY